MLVVYTANIGNYDEMWPAPDGVHSVCFSDGSVDAPGWEVRRIQRIMQHPKGDSLRLKCLPHLWFPDADAWVWLDANMMYNGNPRDLLGYLSDDGIAAFRHPLYSSVYQEMVATAAAHYRNTDPKAIAEQNEALQAEGFPSDAGLGLTGCLVRHNTPDICWFNEAWWADICRWATWRDQFSFTPVLWRVGMRYGEIPGDPRNHERFSYRGHGCGSS